jgi:ParB/RepB/Spo0J family partition protein
MSNKPEDKNDPMETSGQHSLREDTPGSAHQTDDNAQGQQAPAPAKMTTMDQLSSNPAETIRRFINRNFPPEVPRAVPGDVPEPPAPPPPVKPLGQVGSPFSNDLGRSPSGQLPDPHARIQRAGARLDKRRTELRHEGEVRRNGPQGEARSAVLAENVQMVHLDMILDDPEFKNFRLNLDEEKLRELAESMKLEGLKVPITVIQAPGEKLGFFVRAGFRRTIVAIRLGWQTIPAIVLPEDTPLVEEHWTNIIENSARDGLSTYEIANAAKTMRDKFGIKPRDFAMRAGYSEAYVRNLLRCIEVLPDDILQQWRAKARLPLDLLSYWATLPAPEALAQFHLHSGQSHKFPEELKLSPRKRIRNSRLTITSDYGLKRMDRLRFAIQVAQNLGEYTGAPCLEIVDYCMGARDTVPGILDATTKKRIWKARHQGEPQMPEPPDSGNPGEPTPSKRKDK